MNLKEKQEERIRQYQLLIAFAAKQKEKTETK